MLEEATSKIDLESIDQIAYTAGPGLTGALLIGENFAQGPGPGIPRLGYQFAKNGSWEGDRIETEVSEREL